MNDIASLANRFRRLGERFRQIASEADEQYGQRCFDKAMEDGGIIVIDGVKDNLLLVQSDLREAVLNGPPIPQVNAMKFQSALYFLAKRNPHDVQLRPHISKGVSRETGKPITTVDYFGISDAMSWKASSQSYSEACFEIADSLVEPPSLAQLALRDWLDCRMDDPEKATYQGRSPHPAWAKAAAERIDCELWSKKYEDKTAFIKYLIERSRRWRDDKSKRPKIP